MNVKGHTTMAHYWVSSGFVLEHNKMKKSLLPNRRNVSENKIWKRSLKRFKTLNLCHLLLLSNTFEWQRNHETLKQRLPFILQSFLIEVYSWNKWTLFGKLITCGGYKVGVNNNIGFKTFWIVFCSKVWVKVKSYVYFWDSRLNSLHWRLSHPSRPISVQFL